jgi:hypothetical protein
MGGSARCPGTLHVAWAGETVRVVYTVVAYDRGIEQVEGTMYVVSEETFRLLEEKGLMETWGGCAPELNWDDVPESLFGEEVTVSSHLGSKKSTLGVERRDFGPFDDEDDDE